VQREHHARPRASVRPIAVDPSLWEAALAIERRQALCNGRDFDPRELRTGIYLCRVERRFAVEDAAFDYYFRDDLARQTGQAQRDALTVQLYFGLEFGVFAAVEQLEHRAAGKRGRERLSHFHALELQLCI
jgi:hypothetical protein